MGITVDPTKAAALNDWVAVWTNLVGNTCVGNAQSGINIENAAYVTATGNVSHGNGGDGLRLLGAYCSVSGNTLTGNTGHGLAVYGVAGHDYGHHSFGPNEVRGNTAGDYDWAAIASGDVVDVVSRVPGSLRASTTVHGAADTAQETYIGAAGPSGQAGLTMYDINLYRSSQFLAVLSQSLRLDGGALYFGSAGDTTLSRLAAKVLGVNADHVFRLGHAVTASRPSATTAGKGGVFYDETLSKMIVSDGTTWRDTMGTAV